MINSNIKISLANYGLNDREIKVYLAVLGLGDATVKEIAEAAKIKRTTVYLIAEKLAAKSILGQYKAKYGTHYVASKPTALISRLENIKEEMANVLPELAAIEKKELYQPIVRYYKGREGYITVLNESLEGYSVEILYTGSQEDLNNVIGNKYTVDHYIPTRLARNLRFKNIVFADEFSVKLKENDNKELRITKYFPKSLKFSSNMLIYGDKVAYFSSKRELFCVVIESKDIAEMEREKFELMWGLI